MNYWQKQVVRSVITAARRRALPYAKSCGKQFGSWCLTHKARVCFGVLVLYMLWSQLSVNRRIADSLNHVEQPAQASSSPQVKYGLGNVPIDNSPGLPAKLDTDRIRGLVQDVDHLEKSIGAVTAQMNEDASLSKALIDDSVCNQLWARMEGGGFKDKDLPLDWYQCVKNEVDLVGAIAVDIMDYTKTDYFQASTRHLGSVRARIIGGKPTIADLEFLRLTQDWVNSTAAKENEWLPVIRSVNARLQAEFAPTTVPSAADQRSTTN